MHISQYMPKSALGIIICVFVIASYAHGALALEATLTPSRKTIEKGGVFQLYLGMKAEDQAIENLDIQPLLPNGFTLAEPMAQAPKRLSPKSEILLQYTVEAPGVIGRSGVSTREPKEFIFTYSYNTPSTPDGKDDVSRGVVKTSVRYTTAIALYLASGILGLLLAHVIKSLAKSRKEPGMEFGLSALFSHVFREQMLGLVTTLLIGFSVLIVLAKSDIPAQGWYDSLALGITLGILGDENLLGKLKGS